MIHVDRGHSVLAVPVPVLEEFVRARTAHYDAAYLGPADFGQAHVTLLAPWLREPRPRDLARVGELASQLPAFTYELTRVATFPDGTIHVVVTPETGFGRLTRGLRVRWPELMPYEGRFGPHVAPHVTLDAEAGGVDEDDVRAMLPLTLPRWAEAVEVQLQWWQAGHCHVIDRWQLGREEDTRMEGGR